MEKLQQIGMEEKFQKVLKADSVTTSVGALLGVTNVSTYVERLLWRRL